VLCQLEVWEVSERMFRAKFSCVQHSHSSFLSVQFRPEWRTVRLKRIFDALRVDDVLLCDVLRYVVAVALFGLNVLVSSPSAIALGR